MTQKTIRDIVFSMANEPQSEDPEWPSWLLSVGRLFGLSPIQTRWRLSAVARRWRSFRREMAPASRRFEHQICAECGALQDNAAQTCTSCGEKLASPAARLFRTIGLSVPSFISASALLGGACIVIYFRMMMAWPGQGFGTWEGDAFITHGGLAPQAFFDGQWWRVGTAIFMHLGILHIVFNTVGLSQIGPAVEDIFGRGRMVFFFALTGVLAFVASAYLMPHTPTAGASGSLMGLVGVAAGWGHRRGTSQGIAVRNQMLKWGVYTIVFGFMIRANNVAHAAGFIAGAAIGAAFSPESLNKTRRSVSAVAMGIVGSVACVVFVMIALFPPASSRALALQVERGDQSVQDGKASEREFKAGMDRACELSNQGKQAEAVNALQSVAADDVDIASVMTSCMYLGWVKQNCDKYRAGGLDAVLSPEEKQGSQPKQAVADYYRMWCAAKE